MMEDDSLPSLNGLAVAAFESRHAAEMATLISRYRGIPHVAASLREVPLEENNLAIAFAEKLLAHHFHAVIFTTGVGARTLVETLGTRYAPDRIIQALSETIVAARGPKTARVLRDLRIPVSFTVPDPSTWQTLLAELDLGRGGLALPGSRIALQEYGASNDCLLEELRKRGAEVFPVPVYRWDLPEDLGPLKNVLEAIAGGRIRIILFTSAVQVDHVLKVAVEMKIEPRLRQAFTRSIVCSVGPTSTEALANHRLTIDLEAQPHKMGALVYEAARQAPTLLKQKDGRVPALPGAILVASSKDGQPESLPVPPPWHNSRFLKACRREPVDATPVWLMRQAGRYLPEYRALRARFPFLELCKNPDRVAELTVGAAERIAADAAILFADLLLIAEPMGFQVDYEKGSGPLLRPLLRTPADLTRLKEVESSPAYLWEAIRHTRARLDPAKPLIGFAGAPFTLASYLIEGGPSKSFRHTKTLMYREPLAWHALMDFLVRNLARYVQGQIEAGVQAVQIFDSWVGCLGPADYREFVLPHTRALLRSLAPGVPIIHFATGAGLLLEDMRDAGGSVIGLDFRLDLGRAWERIGPSVAVQGNLDPVVLCTDPPYIRRRTRKILDQAAGRPGHIFNLGHGVLPDTPVENVAELVKIVHEESRRILASG